MAEPGNVYVTSLIASLSHLWVAVPVLDVRHEGEPLPAHAVAARPEARHVVGARRAVRRHRVRLNLLRHAERAPAPLPLAHERSLQRGVTWLRTVSKVLQGDTSGRLMPPIDLYRDIPPSCLGSRYCSYISGPQVARYFGTKSTKGVYYSSRSPFTARELHLYELPNLVRGRHCLVPSSCGSAVPDGLCRRLPNIPVQQE